MTTYRAGCKNSLIYFAVTSYVSVDSQALYTPPILESHLSKVPKMPQRSLSGDRRTDLLGIGGLYVFAFGVWAGTAPANLGLAMILVASLIRGSDIWQWARRDPLCMLFAIVAAYVAIRGVVAGLEFPATASAQRHDTWTFAFLWLFPIIAWWLGGSERRIMLALLLAALGFIVAVVRHTPLVDLASILTSVRQGFAWTPLGAALFLATMLLGLLVFAPRIWGSPQQRVQHVVRISVWILLVASLLQMLIVTQARGTLLACFVVFPLVLWFRFRQSLRLFRFARSTRGWLIATVVSLLVGLVLIINWETLVSRAEFEQENFAKVFRLEFDQIPIEGSVGPRVQMYLFGFEKFSERPWFGWGPGTRPTKFMAENEGLSFLSVYPHLHNMYLEILVRLGVTGLVLFLVTVAVLGRAIWMTYRRPLLPQDIALFAAGVVALVLLWGLTNSRLFNADFRFYWLLFAGIAYSAATQANSAQRDTPSPGRSQNEI